MDPILFYLSEYLLGFVALAGAADAWRRRRMTLFLLGVGITFVFTTVLKNLIGGPRPFELFGLASPPDAAFGKEGLAFPSRHAALLTALTLLNRDDRTLFLFSLWATIITVVLRVYLKLHWPADIGGGIMAGILGYAAASWFLKVYAKKTDT